MISFTTGRFIFWGAMIALTAAAQTAFAVLAFTQ